MSKFFVTNSSSWYAQLKRNIQETPFVVSGNYESEGIYAITTKKILVDNVNFWGNGEQMIIQTGTCVYKETSGLNALKSALSDFSGDVQSHREDYIGNFGCFIKKNKTMVAFNEATGFYNIFYYSNKGKWIIGTTLLDMAKVLKDEITLNKMNVLEELTRFAIFDNETYFDEIKRLSGDQYLELSSAGIEIKPLYLRINQENIKDSNTRAKNIAKEMKYIAQVMYKNFGQTTIGCTGGFDSRMTLAAYLAAGIKPKIAYGYGNSNLAPSNEGDVEVVKEFGRLYGLEYTIADWNETVPLDKLWNEHISKYGKLIYDGCEDVFKFYTKKDENFLSFGYNGELFREDDWSKIIPSGRMSLEKYLWGFHAPIINENVIKGNSQLINQWLTKWNKVNTKHGILSERFDKEQLFWLELDYRHCADNHMCNIINQFKYAHYLMSDIRIVRNCYIDFDLKYNGRFMIQILNEVFPDILNATFFTHGHKMKYNHELMQVELSKLTVIRRNIRKMLPSKFVWYLNHTLQRHVVKSSYVSLLQSILDCDNNDKKLQKLIGIDVYNALEKERNYILYLRGLILLKTFDTFGIKY